MKVLGLVCCCILLFSMSSAFAVTRSEINHKEEIVKEQRTQVQKYTDEIAKIQNEINSLESLLAKRKDVEREKNRIDGIYNTSQTREDLKVARDSVRDTEKEIAEKNKEMQLLITKKNLANDTITDMERIITSDKKLLKEKSKIELMGLTRIIGVQLSKTCVTMIKNDFPTNCPTYKDMISLDDSDPRSGKFEMIDGMYQRGTPLVKNDHWIYNFDTDFHIIINPSPELASRIKMITIESSLDTYLTTYDMKKAGDIRTVNHLRFIDSCYNATIDGKNWLELLPDTIYTLRNGCTITKFNTVETIKDKITEIDITTTASYQYQKWLKESKENCKVKC